MDFKFLKPLSDPVALYILLEDQNLKLSAISPACLNATMLPVMMITKKGPESTRPQLNAFLYKICIVDGVFALQ